MRVFPYHQVDVFAPRPLAGNPLAVFPDARGLSDAEMQAVAREMNLSETTFVLPPEDGGHARVRIFTPLLELPFAGHPSVGTACELVRLGLVDAVAPVTHVVLELAVGPTVVEVAVHGGEPVAATVHQGPPRFGHEVPRAEAAAVLRLAPADLHPDLPPMTVGTGLTYTIIPLASPEALARVSLDVQLLPGFEQAHAEVYPCAFTGQDDPWLEARGLFPLAGIPEDPATGSAAGPLAAYMVRAGLLAPDEERVVLQGRHAGRPSELFVVIVADAAGAAYGAPASPASGAATPDRSVSVPLLSDVLVGGAVQLIARGEMYLPPQRAVSPGQTSTG